MHPQQSSIGKRLHIELEQPGVHQSGDCACVQNSIGEQRRVEETGTLAVPVPIGGRVSAGSSNIGTTAPLPCLPSGSRIPPHNTFVPIPSPNANPKDDEHERKHRRLLLPTEREVEETSWKLKMRPQGVTLPYMHDSRHQDLQPPLLPPICGGGENSTDSSSLVRTPLQFTLAPTSCTPPDPPGPAPGNEATSEDVVPPGILLPVLK